MVRDGKGLSIAILILLVAGLLFFNQHTARQLSQARGLNKHLYIIWVERFDPTEPVAALESYLRDSSLADLRRAEDSIADLETEAAWGFGLYFRDSNPSMREIFSQVSRLIGHGREGHIDQATILRVIEALQYLDSAIHRDPMPSSSGGWPIVVDHAYIERITRETLTKLTETK